MASAAASFALAAPAARGGFVLSLYGNGPVTPPAGDAYPDYSVYVVDALNTGGTGNNNTGSTLLGFDLTIQTTSTAAGSLGIDIEQTGSGSSALYTANVTGSQSIPASGLFQGGANSGDQPIFGDTVGGTFLGIGNQPFDPTYVHRVTAASGGTQFVNLTSQFSAATYSKATLSQLNPYFENLGSVNAENIDNGTVHYLEVVDATSLDSAPLDNVTPIPVANIVIPTGQGFTIQGELGGEAGPASSVFLQVVGSDVTSSGTSNPGSTVSNPSGAVSATAMFPLAMTAPPAGYTNIAAMGTLKNPSGVADTGGLSINGSGAAAQLNNISFFGQVGAVKGEISYGGFTPQDPTVSFLFKFEARAGLLAGTDPASNPQVLDDILSYIDANDGGFAATTVPASFAAAFGGMQYDAMISFPNVVSGDPYFGFDFSKFSDSYITAGNLAVTDIGLVPEPTGISLLAIGALGLLRRRRRGM